MLFQRVEERFAALEVGERGELWACGEQLVHGALGVGPGEAGECVQARGQGDVNGDVEAAGEVVEHERRDAGDEHPRHGMLTREDLPKRR